jgi:hypothetical protein
MVIAESLRGPAFDWFCLYPGTLSIPERSTPNVHGVSYKILAEVETTKDSKGVIFAQGSRFGGHALLIKDGKVTYAYNFLGIPPEQRISGAAPGPGKHVIGIEFTKKRMGQYHESYGPLKLYVDDKVVAESEIRTMTGHFSLCGEGLCIGYESGDFGQQRVQAEVRIYGRPDHQGCRRRCR